MNHLEVSNIMLRGLGGKRFNSWVHVTRTFMNEAIYSGVAVKMNKYVSTML